ncbi:MAG: hypothetical protein ABJC36_03615 [Gemmatimonadales bacterium]
MMRLVGVLAGINRYRFERDPQLLVAWRSARHVLTGPQAQEPAATEGPGEVKPAA